MSERPNIVLGLLLTVAAVAGALVTAAVATLGALGIAALATIVIGVFTACVVFLGEAQRVPLPALALALLGLASMLATVRTLAAYIRERRLLRALPLEPLTDEGARAIAEAARIDGFYRTPARQPGAFCFGLLRPRIVLTAGLLAELDEDERTAVLWHEAHHARDHVPLKCLLARLAASSFFWLPTLRDLRDRYLLVKEIAADRLAAARTSRRALAGALLAVAEPVPGTVGIADAAALRAERLLDPAAKLPPLLRRGRLLASALAAALLAFLLHTRVSVGVSESAYLRSMLTAFSFHGLPGMAAGLALNTGALALLAYARRRRTADKPS